MEGFMSHRYMPAIAISAVSLLAAGCYSPPPERVVAETPPPRPVIVVPAAAPDEHAMVIAPTEPPAPRVEVIPAPPSDVVYWVPGHWRWNATADGNSGWTWIVGYYANRPNRSAVWINGHWQQSSAGWLWVDGYWQ
jgi:hypothetical protein